MRDAYGNYVIQTALEFAPAELCVLLIEAMRPILPAIRQTPYGRRIMSKVSEREGRLAHYSGRTSSGHGTPQAIMGGSDESVSGYAPSSSAYAPSNVATIGYQGNNGYHAPNGSSGYQAPMYTATANYGPNIASPQPHRQPHRLSNPNAPHHMHNNVHQNNGYQNHHQQYSNSSNGGNRGNWF
jgi:hypothetical protein